MGCSLGRAAWGRWPGPVSREKGNEQGGLFQTTGPRGGGGGVEGRVGRKQKRHQGRRLAASFPGRPLPRGVSHPTVKRLLGTLDFPERHL